MASNDRTASHTGQPVTLCSESLQVVVTPALGGQIVSLSDAVGHEYLARAPHPRPPDLPLYAPYLEGGLGGIDDCLPAIAAEPYPPGPYAGWLIPDHGELWQRPWDVIHQTSSELTLAITGSRLPYRLTRTATVAGDVLRVEYCLSSNCDTDLPVVWAAHALLAVTPGAVLDIGNPTSLMTDQTSSAGIAPYSRIPYPRLRLTGKDIDLRYWDTLPPGFFMKGFAPLAAGAPVALHHPQWGTALTIVTRSDHPLHIGLWLNRGGIPSGAPLEHVALEPTFGSADLLSRAVDDGSCLVLKARASPCWTVSYQVVQVRRAKRG